MLHFTLQELGQQLAGFGFAVNVDVPQLGVHKFALLFAGWPCAITALFCRLGPFGRFVPKRFSLRLFLDLFPNGGCGFVVVLLPQMQGYAETHGCVADCVANGALFSVVAVAALRFTVAVAGDAKHG